ncbi:MAG: hypothetical protein MI749_04900 [Desulfovibrionales bacterium]|nr:hypothetical protein [Desulfovibrionales bacterium]
MNIHQIQEASRGGFARIDSNTGELKTKGHGLGGRIIEWFRGKLHPGTVAKENSAVMNAFIRAIGDDPKYGPSYANMAAEQLMPQLEQGKSLTERRITTVLDSLDANIEQNKSLNALQAQRFSSHNIPGDPNCFGSIWANLAHEANLPFDPEAMKTSTLEYGIQRAIKNAGEDGKHFVTNKEAKEIATEKIRDFVETGGRLLAAIKKEAVSDAESAFMQSKLCDMTLSKSISTNGFITQARLEDKLGPEFNQTLKRMATERGLEDMLPNLYTKKVKQAVSYSLDAKERAVTREEIQDVIEQKLAKFLDGKQRAAEVLDTLDLSPESRARMRQNIAERPSFKDADHVKQAVVVADLFDNLTDMLVAGTPADAKAALELFQTKFMEAFEPLRDERSSANDFIPLMGNGITIWKEQRAETEVLQPLIDNIMYTIDGETGRGIIADLEHRAETSEQALYDLSAMNNLFDQIKNTLTDVDFSRTTRE